MNTAVSMERTPTNAAQPGDLITYAYYFTRWGIKDFRVTTRGVISVKKEGEQVVGYFVDGDYFVELKHVQQVISTNEEEPQRGFPLEVGQ